MKTLKGWARLFLFGFCMGASDLVPGISGGTTALILGVYEDFIKSLCTLDHKAFLSFIQLRWNRLFSLVAWKFLSALILGMGCAIFSLAPIFHYLLNDPVLRSVFLALFAGLIISSSFFVFKKIPKWDGLLITFFFLGLAAALAATLLPFLIPSLNLETIVKTQRGVMIWMLFSGILSVSAMLLPGISGSYVLTILQAYPIIIGALANVFRFKAFLILASLSAGIFIGALLFSRVIRWFLSYYRETTLATLIGFMLGALPAVWPFWKFRLELNPLLNDKPFLHPEMPMIPDPSSLQFWAALLFFSIGLLLVIFFESIPKLKTAS